MSDKSSADWLRQQERSNLAILRLMVWISLTFGRAIGRVDGRYSDMPFVRGGRAALSMGPGRHSAAATAHVAAHASHAQDYAARALALSRAGGDPS